MARGINRLTDREVKAFKGPGRVADGGGLYWNGATFSFLYTSPVTGKRREAGLGAVTLAQARAKATDHRDVLATGLDPIQVVKAAKQAGMTFLELAAETFNVLKPKWRHLDREQVKWDRAIEACKAIHGDPVAQITVEDIRLVLKPFDDRVPQKRFVLSVIRRVFDVAVAKGLRSGNPAVARIIAHVTPLDHTTTHNKSLPYRAVPSFCEGLRTRATLAARALEFIILTGARKTEATQAKWPEFDLNEGVWHIPASRMKNKRPHDVPLTDRAMQIIRHQLHERIGDHAFVFPGSRGGRGKRADHLSASAFLHLTPGDVTVHGFRSSLREYLGDETDVSYETAEETISHRVGDRTASSYRRASGLAKRRAALTYWHDFVMSVPKQNSDQDQIAQTIQLAKDAAA
ncbi:MULTISPECIES: site-specific integrase [unclassified Mesorhizobium]|uniref:tyrosine-type recombinase/integrase n=1 Tax=unclassified Mesorhizobium TaxID=325217 RepID=UPI000FCC3FEE|nr:MULTISPECIES: site-specific integrase [unclassified Mesorhizobium]RUX97457.1 site-specific integrase [Mesorhizobium sp. M7D.F.Ca.US.004.01.2.1]RVA36643.1 site-specific integrase [Mesorhizobium sp. M7D.F.Ca.US.004.03.1.1]